MRPAQQPCPPRNVLASTLIVTFIALLSGVAACNIDPRQSGVPADAQAAIDRITDDIAGGRFDDIYTEAAEEWRRTMTPDANRATLERLRDRLGHVETRTFHTGRDQQNATGELSGHVLVITYETDFERGNGMETFTLVQRDGRWLLARYFVSSDALKQ